MKKLTTTVATVILIAALGTVAFGGQGSTSPCALPEPGQTDTPPCTTVNGYTDDATEVGQALTQSRSDAVDTVSFVERALITFLMF